MLNITMVVQLKQCALCSQASLVKKLMKEPVFHESIDGASLEEERQLTMRQIKALVDMKFSEKGMNKELYKVGLP